MFARFDAARAAEPTAFVRDVRPFVQKYCLACHDGKKPEAGLDLKSFQGQAPPQEWAQIWQRLRTLQMPPAEKSQPTADERQRVVAWIEGQFARHHVDGQRDPGPLTPRRLNVRQIKNSLRDLVALGPAPLPRINPFDPANHVKPEKGQRNPGVVPEGFGFSTGKDGTGVTYRLSGLNDSFRFVEEILPTDTDSGGFDTVEDNLSIPPFLVEKYLRCSESLFDEFAFQRVVKSAVPADRWELKRQIESLKKQPADRQQAAVAAFLQSLASRAYRRPVRAEELERHVQLFEAARADEDSFEAALWMPIQAILTSPRFVVLWGEQNASAAADSPSTSKESPSVSIRPLNDYELASRLSYFLWSSLPDAELTQAAEKGRLQDPAVLEQQVRRMLADDRVRDGLLHGFLLQWLQLPKLAGAAPDPEDFPQYYQNQTGEFLRRELMLFAESMLWEDRSVLEFLDAESGYLCEPLVLYYGMKPTGGRTGGGPDRSVWQRVNFPDDRRGGLLTMGLILTGTSKPERTSPVNRGKWVLETILGITPPPPPPNVDNELKSEQTGKTLTVRQSLEQHRADAKCYSCHRMIDPIGLGLEHYDPIGRWREQENGNPIDASGTLYDGGKFAGVEELKTLLMERKDDFTRCLVEKMLAYALGRRLEFYDVQTVSEICQAVGKDEYRLSRVVIEVARSYPFRHCRSN